MYHERLFVWIKKNLNVNTILSWRSVQIQVAHGPKSLTLALNQNLTQGADASQDLVVSDLFIYLFLKLSRMWLMLQYTPILFFIN